MPRLQLAVRQPGNSLMRSIATKVVLACLLLTGSSLAGQPFNSVSQRLDAMDAQNAAPPRSTTQPNMQSMPQSGSSFVDNYPPQGGWHDGGQSFYDGGWEEP